MNDSKFGQVEVTCYSGYRAEERPVHFRLGGHAYEIREILDRWYEPEGTFFKVLANDGNIYVLRHRLHNGWSLEAFRRGSQAPGE